MMQVVLLLWLSRLWSTTNKDLKFKITLLQVIKKASEVHDENPKQMIKSARIKVDYISLFASLKV